jgi:hypothetical protein
MDAVHLGVGGMLSPLMSVWCFEPIVVSLHRNLFVGVAGITVNLVLVEDHGAQMIFTDVAYLASGFRDPQSRFQLAVDIQMIFHVNHLP